MVLKQELKEAKEKAEKLAKKIGKYRVNCFFFPTMQSYFLTCFLFFFHAVCHVCSGIGKK